MTTKLESVLTRAEDVEHKLFHDDQSKTIKELQAQIGLMISALIPLMEIIELHKLECWQYELAGQILSSTPAEAADLIIRQRKVCVAAKYREECERRWRIGDKLVNHETLYSADGILTTALKQLEELNYDNKTRSSKIPVTRN